jgi:hypothetical protein
MTLCWVRSGLPPGILYTNIQYIGESIWVILTNSLIRFSVTTHRFCKRRNVQGTGFKNGRNVQGQGHNVLKLFFSGHIGRGHIKKHQKTVEQIVRIVELSKAVRRGKRVRGVLIFRWLVGGGGEGEGEGGEGTRGVYRLHTKHWTSSTFSIHEEKKHWQTFPLGTFFLVTLHLFKGPLP